MAPPLPAASRPSNTSTMRSPRATEFFLQARQLEMQGSQPLFVDLVVELILVG